MVSVELIGSLLRFGGCGTVKTVSYDWGGACIAILNKGINLMNLSTNEILQLTLAIGVSFAVSFASTPIVKSFAHKVGAIDVPKDDRRMHKEPIPRMGGLAIFLGFIVSVLLFADITTQVRGVLLGALVIVVCGAVDDITPLRATVKLGAQIVAAVIAVSHGVVIEVLRHPIALFNDQTLYLGVLAVPVTILWIVGITNSVNLIDGLDGLAVGVSAIASVTMLVVALLVSDINVAVILGCLVGGCVGFMPYNLNPAKIFMGDTGALLLGFVLSTVSAVGLFKFYALVSFVAPVLALALPLFDTSFAIIRRVVRGQSPMMPDRGHLHHRLVDMGLSQKQAVAVLYSISAILGLAAVVLATNGVVRILLLIAALVIAVTVGVFLKKAKDDFDLKQKDEEGKKDA